MKTFVVKGQNWTNEVEVDPELFNKYGDMAFEGMTQGVEKFFNKEYEQDDFEDEAGLGMIMLACEEGLESDPDKQIACLTEYVLVNAGYHKLAVEAKKIRDKWGEEGE